MVVEPASLVPELESLDLDACLRTLAAAYPGRVAFSTSLGQEDQVITDAIARNDLEIRLFTLDTGRLFEETYALLDRTRERYGRTIESYFPDAASVERLLTDKGAHSFRESVANRQECCRIRKVMPLRRALDGASVWITGLRSEQSAHRQRVPLAAWDPEYSLLKVNPLLRWSDAEVHAYIERHDVPVNPLHARGFASIGCAPCTRAIGPHEHPRDGRWWWEASVKECGLHRP
jgi:phosphoadenosine phosphosulfate reductase